MTEGQINLNSPKKRDKTIEQYIVTPSLLIFVVVFLIAAGVIIFSLVLKSNLSEAQARAQSIRSQIAALNLKKEKILVTHERLAAVSSIISTRSKLDEAVLFVLSQIPEGFLIDSISVDDKAISLGVASNNLAEFADLFENKIPDLVSDNKFGIRSAEVSSFSKLPLGYSASLKFALANMEENAVK